MNVKSLPQRVFELSLGALAVAVILTWTWALLQPLVPVIVGMGSAVFIAAAIGRWYLGRRQSW
jgi:hypothetical protein